MVCRDWYCGVGCLRVRYCGENTAGELLRERYCGRDTAGKILRERYCGRCYCGRCYCGRGATAVQRRPAAVSESVPASRDVTPLVGDRDRTSRHARWMSTTRRVSSRNGRIFGDAAYCAGLWDRREAGLLGFRGMRGEQALRCFSHHHLPSCRHIARASPWRATRAQQSPTITHSSHRSNHPQ